MTGGDILSGDDWGGRLLRFCIGLMTMVMLFLSSVAVSLV